MSRLSLMQISKSVSAQRELNNYSGIGIKCMCFSGDKREHEAIYEANRW